MKYEIEKFHPCKDSIVFRSQFDTFEQAWKNCPRGDWMLWIASKLGVDKRTLVLTKGYCAKTVIHLMKDKRSKDAVIAAIQYGKGLIEDDVLAAYTDAAYAAAYAAAADAAYAAYADNAAYTDAAYAAAYAAAADAAYTAAADNAAYTDAVDNAAYAAAYAADNAAYADAAAAAYAAKTKNQMKTARICRKYLTKAVMDKINNEKEEQQ